MLRFVNALIAFAIVASKCAGPCTNTTCLSPSGAIVPCGPDAQRCGPPRGGEAALFHFRDATCGINDPNAPFYDSRSGLYHLFYQNHVSLPLPKSLPGDFQPGPTIGHAVSSDLVRWAQLPVALWNAEAFDLMAVFTGSATLVGAEPRLIFPGICQTGAYWPLWPGGCATYFNAVAANSSDELLTNWTITRVIANRSGADPTGAWRTADGEWRFAGSHGTVYSADSWDGNWSETPVPIFMPPTYNDSKAGISCGDLFPRPQPCDGCPPAAPSDPTHVYKLLDVGPDGLGGDWFWFGNYSDGAHGSGGVWAPEPYAKAQPYGKYGHAAKSFHDFARGERTQWQVIEAGAGFASGVMALADLRWDTVHHRVTAAPVPALATLRATPPLFSAAALTLVAGSRPLWLGDWPRGAGNASEFGATFALPALGETSSFGVLVLAGGAHKGVNASIRVTISVDRKRAANLTIGGDSPASITSITPLFLARDAPSVTLRVFVDRVIVEVFAAGTVAYLHVPAEVAEPAANEAGMALFAGTSAALEAVKSVDVTNVTAWAMNSAFIGIDELRVRGR